MSLTGLTYQLRSKGTQRKGLLDAQPSTVGEITIQFGRHFSRIRQNTPLLPGNGLSPGRSQFLTVRGGVATHQQALTHHSPTPPTISSEAGL